MPRFVPNQERSRSRPREQQSGTGQRKRRSRRSNQLQSFGQLGFQWLEARLMLANQPDLVITAATVPATAIEGNASQISISWTVKNQGTAAATGNWSDAVYLSSSGAIDSTAVNVDFLSEAFHGPLAPGASYTINRVVSLPEYATGSQKLVFNADEGNVFGDSGTTGNIASRSITLSAPSVDLAVTGATLSSTSVVGGDGQQVDVSWTTQNKGTVPATDNWDDAVYLSTKQTLDASAHRLTSSDGPLSRPLAAGASYTSHAALTIPDVAAGQYYLIFSANDDQTQGESDQASDTNDTLAKPLTVTSPGSVDLAVSGVTVNGNTTPQTAVEGNGQTVSVAYTVSNAGTVAAASQWLDGIYLSSKNTFDSTAVLLSSLAPPSASGLTGLALAAGSSYTNHANVVIPQWATGSQFLLIDTDTGDVQSETNKANNVVAVPITLNAPNVDLKVTSAQASLTSAVVGNGTQVAVTYTVQNIGSGPADGDWEDAIYLSSKSTYDSSATYLDTIGQFGGSNNVPSTLAAGASYTVTDMVTIPDDNSLGSDFLLVRANTFGGDSNEQTESNFSNNGAAVPITLTAPAANLAISGVQGAPTTVEAGNGQQLNLSWTVTNNGSAAANSTWLDNVVLANDPNYSNNVTRLLSNPVRESDLAAGAHYTVAQTVTVPNLPAGAKQLVFVTDDSDQQSETQKSDNVATQAITLTTPNVDLTVSGQGPTSAIEGQSLPVSWTVTNNGSEAAKGSWSDAVYLSNDPVFDDTAVLLTTVAGPNAPLAASTGSYSQTAQVTIPATATGAHYLLFVTNNGQTQGETNYTNDVNAIPITLSAPDLAVTAANVTTSPVNEGGKTNLTWTVTNESMTTAAPADWFDSVFVSDHPYFDSTTTYVASFDESSHAGLAAGGTYTDSEQVSVPQFATGAAYLLFVTDLGKQFVYYNLTRGQPEVDTSTLLPGANDVKAVQVTLKAPDLSVTAATAPTSTIVEGAPISVSWTVKNLSADTPAQSDWYDAVYVSSKPTFDSSAVLAEDFNEGAHAGLAAGVSYTDNESVTIPQFATGSQYLLFVTDDLSGTAGQPETDGSTVPGANDVKAVSVTLAAPDLSVVAATAPTTAIDEGAKISVSWQVQNLSTTTPAPASWYDSVYVSSRPTFDSSAVFVADYSESSHAGLAAGANYTGNETLSVPRFAVGGAYLLFVTDYPRYNGGQPQTDGGLFPSPNDVKAVPITLVAPDLQLVTASVPATAVEGAQINVNWSVKNLGPVAAQANWYDAVYVSSKTTLDSSARLITDFSESSHSGLAAGGTYNDAETLSVPQFATGNQYLLFVTNYSGSQPENSNSSPDANDVFAVPISLSAPDLTVTAATAPTTTITEGAPITVSWTVKNQGTVAAPASWYDSVYVSSSPTFSGNAVFIQSFNESSHSGLAAGSSYPESESISVPQFATGSEYLLFVTDYNSYSAGQPQSDGNNGIPAANDVKAVPVTLNAPDLKVSAASAPSTAVVGNNAPIAVSYTVKNISSTATASASWTDALYVSDQPTFNSSDPNQKFIADLNHPAGALAAGASYTVNQNITLNNIGTTDKYLLFVTNSTGSQPESDASTSGYNFVPPTNDVESLPITLSEPNVDLQLTGASVPAPNATLTVGDDTPVAFTVKNAGTVAAAAGWYDEVYFSQHATFDSSAISLQYSQPLSVPLAAGASYTVHETVAVPDYDSLPLGSGYLLFVTNYNTEQGETDVTGNTPDANDVFAVPVTLAAPDLAVTAATAPTTVTAGQANTVAVNYTVKNQGTVYADSTWRDSLYLSNHSTFDSSAVSVTTLTNSPDELAPGDSYSLSTNVTLPSESAGQMYLLFVANANGGQIEEDGLPRQAGYVPDANDVKAVPITFAAPAVNLAVTGATAPTGTIEAGNGGQVSIGYTVTNNGTGAASQTWQDKLYISSSQTLDSTAQFVATLNKPAGTLAAGGHYTVSQSVTLPPVSAGQHYLLFVADADGGQAESTGSSPDANDVQAVSITTSAPNVDLALSNPASTSTALSAGGTVGVSFTVKNTGSETAAAAWTDAVYLSASPTLDATAIQLKSVATPGTLAVGVSYNFNQTVTLPSNFTGAGYLLLVTNANRAQGETNAANDLASIPVTVSPQGLPELAVTNFALVNDPTSTAAENGKVSVTWTVKNQGAAAAAGTWEDTIYYSTAPTFNYSTSTSLGTFTEPSTPGLAVGATYTDTQQVTIPESANGGSGYLIVRADWEGFFSPLPEQGNQNGATDLNNIANLPITVQAPNLSMTTAKVNNGSSATAAIGNNVQLSLSETVKNISTTVAASGFWDDEVFISTKPTYDSSANYLTSFFGEPSSLAAGSTYTLNTTATIGSDFTPGGYYLLFVANASGQFGESDGGGGPFADTNDVMSVPLTLTAPNVDLVISKPSGPSTAVEGQSYPVSFTVTNNGADTASASWDDAVYFSYKPTFDSTAQELTSAFAPMTLAHGANYNFNRNVTIPASIPVGSGYLLLVTNADGNQSETNTTNDVVSLPITVQAPDLAVTSVIAPSSGVLNGQVQVTWTVKNEGTVAAPTQGWYDAVYLSTEPVISVGANYFQEDYSYLGTFPEAATGLAAGSTYTDTQTVTIPGTQRTGDLYLVVVTDMYGDQGDINRLNNAAALPIHLSAPNADLAVTSVTVPSSGILGGTVNVSWTVKNQGTLAANANWQDSVYLSTSPTLDNSATLLQTFSAPPPANSPLAPGASYTLQESLTLPNATLGQEYILVQTNSNSAQSETNFANDVSSQPITLTAPDLTVTAASANGLTSNITAALGQAIPVTWTVKNIGAVKAPALWDDQVYISSKPTLDATAKEIESFDESSHQNLAAGTSYTDNESITIPQFALGAQYLLFVTTGFGEQPESNTTNNVLALPITLAAPDLAVTGATAPGSAVLGTPLQVSWTVANQGPVAAVSTWTDAVYVSNVPALDATATLLSTFGESKHQNLPGSGSTPANKYTDTENVTLPSTNIGGRYLLFVTNVYQTQPESDAGNDTNDVFAVPITVTGADLTVTSPSAPALAAVGATIPVSWNVVNQGNATASATWTDAVYFSTKTFFDNSAVAAGSFAVGKNSPLAAGASYSQSQQITIPNAAAGDTYLLIVTNSNGAQAESNTANDVVALPIELASVDLAAAGISGPASANFGNSINVSWTVNTTSNLPIQAPFSDSIYLSTKSTFDASATLLKTVNESAIEPITANGSYTQTAQVALPLTAVSANGGEYLYVVADSGNQVIETNENNNVAKTPISLTLPTLPNLVPTNIAVPASGLTGQSFVVSWTDQNNGTATATGPWQDDVWISTSNTLTASAQFLGQFTYPDTLAPGQTAARAQSFNLPGTAGTYYVIVRADGDGAVNEGPNAADDTAASASTINVAATPLPDLVVTSVTPPTNGVLSGTTVPVTFTIKNEGNAATQVPSWTDAVFVSQLNTIQLTGNNLVDAQKMLDQPLGVPYFPQNASALNPGQSYQETINISLPASASGTWYVYVVTDQNFLHTPLDNFIDPGPVRESNYINNLTVSAPFTVTQAPLPDLATTSVQAPSQVFSGQTATVTWSVANQGTGVAVGQPLHVGFAPTQPNVPATPSQSTWQESIYMSTTQSIDGSAILLDTFTHSGALPPGDSYTESDTVRLPVGVSGKYYFLVQTNSASQVFEGAATPNDTLATSTASTVNLTPPPELDVTSIVAPATALASHQLVVNYTVTNNGPGATPIDPTTNTITWMDTLYLSPTPTLDTTTALKLGVVMQHNALAAGAAYTDAESYTLPDGLTGTYYVIVVADSSDAVFQVNRAGGTVTAPNSTVISSHPAHLVVTAATAPSTANPGQVVPMTWTVTNQGTGDTAVSYWVDKVYATTASTLGSNRVLVASFVHTGLLNAGASYTDNELVTIPYTITGQYNLFVYANAPVTAQEDGPAAVVSPPNGFVYELNPSQSISAPIPITVSSKLADLQVPSVTVTPPAGGVKTGNQVTVNWTVKNAGTATTSSTHWYDDVYVSPTPTFNAQTAVYLGSAYDNNPLAAGAQVNDSLSVLVPPSLAAGNDYFLVLADRPVAPPSSANIPDVDETVNLVTESNENNNTGASAQTAIALGPTPDLTTTITTAPTSTVTGDDIQVNWTVTNKGVDTLPANSVWYDEVYLSLDTTIDESSIPIGSLAHHGGLLGSESSSNSYNASDILQLPAGLTGNYYIIVEADVQGSVFQSKPNDRIAVSAQPLNISLTPPIDLVAGTVTVPANAVPGEPMTVTYTVNNNSANANSGDWYDSLYLSTTTTWQLSNPLFDRVLHQGGVSANGHYSATATAPLPGVAPGTYYLILRSNIFATVPETNTANNLSASSQISLAVPSIVPGTPSAPGTPATGSLTQGGSAFYQVTVAAGQTLRLSLTDSGTNDVNGLYVSFGDMPSPSHYDFAGSQTLVANQTITIPSTQAGTYYIDVANNTVFGYNAQSNPSVTAHYSLSATIIPFSVSSVTPSQVGNAGNSTLEITGAKFDRDTTFQLIDSKGHTIQASAVNVTDSATAYATFNLTGASLGSYAVQATASGGGTTELVAGLTVVTGSGPQFSGSTTGQSHVRLNREATFDVVYGNTGDADMAAPLITVTSPFNNPMSLYSGLEDTEASVLQFFATNPNGPAGILPPGSQASSAVFFDAGDESQPFGFQLSVTTASDTTPIDWSVLAANYVDLSNESLPNWNAIYARVQQNIGTTWGDFVQALSHDATLMPASMGDNRIPSELMQMEINRAIVQASTSISGTVEATDPGVSYAGRTVYAENTTTGDEFSGTVLNDGSFAIAGVTNGTYELTVGGLNTVSSSAVSVANGTSVSGATIRVANGLEISGNIFAPGGTVPVASAIVTVTAANGTVFSDTTAADGSYAIDGLVTGTYSLSVQAAGYAQQDISGLSLGSIDLTQNVTLNAQATLTGQVTLQPGGPGGPVTVLAVKTDGSDAGQVFEATVTLPDFVVGDLPAGTYNVTASANGYLPQTITGVSVLAGAQMSVGSLSLVVPATISGSVSSAIAGFNPQSVAVTVYEGTTAVGSVQPAANGGFTVDNLPSGTYTLEILSATVFTASQTVTVVDGQNLTGVSLVVEPGGTIAGTVLNSQGSTPLAGLPVFAFTPAGGVLQTLTAADGSYQFAGLALGTYQVSVPVPSGGAPQSAVVSALNGAKTTINFNVSAPFNTKISGSVTDAANHPLSGVTIDLIQNNEVVATTNSDASGNYGFQLLNGGTFSLQALPGEASFPSVANLTVATGASVQQNLVAGAGSLTVTVTNGGQAVSNAIVFLKTSLLAQTVELGAVSTGSNGTATFSDLAPGSYQVVVTAPAGAAVSASTNLTAGQSLTLPVSLATAYTVSGTVTGTGGAAVSGAAVGLSPSADPTDVNWTSTSSSGAFSFGSVAPGTYDLVTIENGYQALVRTGISVQAAVNQTVSLVASQVSVMGRLTDTGGDPVAGAIVSAVNPSGHVVGDAITAADGSFTFTTLSGAGLTLEINAKGFAQAQHAISTVPASGSLNVGTISLSLLALPLITASPTVVPALAANGGPGATPSTSPVAQPLDNPFAGLQGAIQAVANQAMSYVPGFQALAQEAQQQVIANQVHELLQYPPPPDPDCPQCNSQYDAAIMAVDRANDFWNGIVKPDLANLSTDAGTLQGIWLLEGAAFASSVGLALFGLAQAPVLLFVPELAEEATAASLAAGWVNTILNNVSEMISALGNMQNAKSSDQATATVGLITTAGNGANIGANTAAQLAAHLDGGNLLGPLLAGPLTGFISLMSTLINNPMGQTVKAIGTLQQAEDSFNNNFQRYLQLVADALKAETDYAQCESSKSEQDCECEHNNTNCKQPPPGGGNGNNFGQWPPKIPSYPFSPFDPNEMIGPQGYGDQQFVPANQPLDYTIEFENESTANAPAQEVTITEQLDPHINPDSFRLGNFGWGGQTFSPPPNSSYYQTTIDETATLGVLVQVTATIDVTTDTAVWDFLSIDPTTGQKPADPSLGFLPPIDSTGIGEGFVSYSVLPNANVKTGDVIDAQATVVFDANPPINTNQVFNTIDTGNSLGSQVTNLPANEGSDQFTISWAPAGQGAGSSAVATYTVYVSDNGGPFVPFIEDTTSTSATFTGQKGHTYKFYSLATDNAGNAQSAAAATTVTTTVGDVVATPLPVAISPTEGAAFSGSVATFTGSDPSGTSTDFTASIVWGDGATTAGTVAGTANGYSVVGSHTYAEAGALVPLAIIITDEVGNHTTISNPTTVADAPLTPTGKTFTATEGLTVTGTVATFTDGNSLATVGSYTAMIDWGDGTSTSIGTVSTLAGGGFAVSGSHVYAAVATRAVTVTINDVGGSKATAHSTADVLDATLTPTGVTIHTTEGATFNGNVATFADGDPIAPASDFTATIDWGDGTTTTGTVATLAGGGAGVFAVSGSHIYAAEATKSVTVTIHDVGGSSGTAHSTADIADASLSATSTTLTAIEGATFTGAVAAFTDANPLATAAAYTATIDWGDGTSSTGQVTTATGSTGFVVNGSHVYSHYAASLTATVTVSDTGGAVATASDVVKLADAPIVLTPATVAIPAGGVANNLLLATFTHAGDETASSFTATVDWGDGSSSAATVSESGGVFQVVGSHSYVSAGAFTIGVSVTDQAGTTNALTEQSSVELTAHEKYVSAVYEDVLGRLPDPGGLAYWSNLIDTGTEISSVAQSIAHSAEYYANFVIKPAYLNLLGRAADDAGVTFWTHQMVNGLTDQELEAGFVSSAEFYANAGGTNSDWIEAIYKLLLGRTADQSGVDYWNNQLTNGATLYDVAVKIANSTENNTQLIDADYEHYLGRAADPDGLAYWLQQFANGQTNEDVISGFTGSQEYYDEHTS
ncbi:MAG TPA: CARDB domain-containing protein [Pirellulales bacterium]|nr:CARDB domain-containing protein [Pirellulales bacterium]